MTRSRGHSTFWGRRSPDAERSSQEAGSHLCTTTSGVVLGLTKRTLVLSRPIGGPMPFDVARQPCPRGREQPAGGARNRVSVPSASGPKRGAPLDFLELLPSGGIDDDSGFGAVAAAGAIA